MVLGQGGSDALGGGGRGRTHVILGWSWDRVVVMFWGQDTSDTWDRVAVMFWGQYTSDIGVISGKGGSDVLGAVHI